MYKYCIVALCLFAACEAAIVPANVSRRLNNPFGVVEGVLPCPLGSAGTIVQVRVTDCTRVPCQTIVGNTYDVGIDFRPSASHTQLHLKVILIHQGEASTIIDRPVENSGVEAGGLYTFTYPMTISGLFVGFGDLRIEISGISNSILELCGIAGINIVEE